eukprot:Phypoly_transcript_13301.p1 GENE.Phypoly_transcript_13301~~Phypoly_transcript_13301.p1  ORF type:complete len:166 (+),score=30.49 Phypoly_transcript_13301:218-715(+)
MWCRINNLPFPTKPITSLGLQAYHKHYHRSPPPNGSPSTTSTPFSPPSPCSSSITMFFLSPASTPSSTPKKSSTSPGPLYSSNTNTSGSPFPKQTRKVLAPTMFVSSPQPSMPSLSSSNLFPTPQMTKSSPSPRPPSTHGFKPNAGCQRPLLLMVHLSNMEVPPS